MTKPSILVFAYNEVGYECLDALIQNDEYIIAVITHEDNPREEIWFRSVAELAAEYDIPVYTPDSVNTPEWIERIRQWSPDLIFSFYYRNMIAEDILKLPRLGAFNMHGSLLPRYRGRVPINWAVLHGETETGATLHHMVKRPDAGDIVDQQTVAIEHDDTAQDVFRKVVSASRLVLERSFDKIASGKAPRIKQDESQATYFGGRTPEDGRIDWTADAQKIYNLVRAVTHPYPGAFTTLKGRNLYLWRVRAVAAVTGAPGEVVTLHPLQIAAGSGGIEIETLQWEGEDEQDASFATHGLQAGQVLGTAE